MLAVALVVSLWFSPTAGGSGGLADGILVVDSADEIVSSECCIMDDAVLDSTEHDTDSLEYAFERG